MELLVEIAGRSKVLLGHLYRAFFNRERLSVTGVRRTEGRVSVTATKVLASHSVRTRSKRLLAASEPPGAEAVTLV